MRKKQTKDSVILNIKVLKSISTNILINIKILNNEFEYIGGEGFTFTPYKETTPIVGGISKNSIY